QPAQHYGEDQILAVVHFNILVVMPLGNGVVALAAPGMATADPPQCEPPPAERPIAGDCGDRIGRAARLVAAARRQNLLCAVLATPEEQDQQPRDHFARRRSSASASSVRINPKSRSTPLSLPIITWSEPAKPFGGTISRASARKRRFMRLRTTAP